MQESQINMYVATIVFYFLMFSLFIVHYSCNEMLLPLIIILLLLLLPSSVHQLLICLP